MNAADYFPWWMPLVSWLFPLGNDGMTRPERRWMARQYRRTSGAPLTADERARLDAWRARRSFTSRYEAAHRVEPWGARMDALLELMREDPTLFAEAAKETARKVTGR